jgi:hypothetical protein
MKKCKIIEMENGFSVRGTNFLHHCDADMYAYYLANTLNNGGKLIYVANVDEAIEKHNQSEKPTNGDWLRLCWNRNVGTYLHTQNMYALRDNSLHGNIHQWYKDADQWWDYMPVETKAVFSGIDSHVATDYHYHAFWAKIQSSDKDCIHKYWRYRKGLIRLDEDDANSLQMEVICELAELQLDTGIQQRPCGDVRRRRLFL